MKILLLITFFILLSSFGEGSSYTPWCHNINPATFPKGAKCMVVGNLHFSGMCPRGFFKMPVNMCKKL